MKTKAGDIIEVFDTDVPRLIKKGATVVEANPKKPETKKTGAGSSKS